MKTLKTAYPLIAATIIAGGLIPVSFGDEKAQVLRPFPAAGLPNPSQTKVETDPVKIRLNDEVIQPLMHQANMRSRFSRRTPTHLTSYHLVETTSEKFQGARTFTVMQKMVPFMNKAKEVKSKEFVKLRHLSSGDQIQVGLKGQWVSLSEHPILKSLPKLPPQNKITP